METTVTLRNWWMKISNIVLRLAVTLMSVLALVWLGYQFWRLLSEADPIWASSPVGAVDLKMRHEEVHGWFAGIPVYGGPNTGYPPASFVLFWPLLGWLELTPARWLWAVATIAALIWLIYLLFQETGAETTLERVFVALIPLAIYPTGATIGNGQLMVLLLPALVAGLARLQGARSWRADLLAASLMLIALVKPSVSVPFFWILLIVPRTWRPAVLVVIGYLGLTFFAAAFQDSSLVAILRVWLSGVSGLASWGGYANLHALLAAVNLENWSLPASFLLLLALGLWVYRHRERDPWLLLGVTGFITRFWTYHGWYDDLLILLPMIALYRIAKRSTEGRQGIIAGVLFACTLLVMLAPGGLYLLPPPWKTLYVTVQVVVWILGLIFLLDQARRDKNTQLK